eukprot:SAG31_NODE_68_length_28153_cov_23.647717_22_plen_260_part_00
MHLITAGCLEHRAATAEFDLLPKVLVPVTKKFVKKLRSYQKDILKYTDDRVKITQEVMAGIRIIKLMAWERSFADKIAAIRNLELQKIRTQAIYRALYYGLSMSVPLVTVTVTLAVYTAVMGNRLTASTAFPALSLLNSLRQPMQELPEVLMNLLVEGRTSLDRMNAFMSEPDISLYVTRGPARALDEECISIRKGIFRWAPGNKSVWNKNDRYSHRKGYCEMVAELCGCKKRRKIEVESVEMQQVRCTFFIVYKGRMQ